MQSLMGLALRFWLCWWIAPTPGCDKIRRWFASSILWLRPDLFEAAYNTRHTINLCKTLSWHVDFKLQQISNALAFIFLLLFLFSLIIDSIQERLQLCILVYVKQNLWTCNDQI